MKICILFVYLTFFSFAYGDDLFKNFNCPVLINSYPFIKCNERNQEEILNEIFFYPSTEKSLHIGWSIEFNYKIICIRNPEQAIICDISKNVFLFYDCFRSIILISEYENFIDLLENEFINKYGDIFSRAKRTRIKSNIQNYRNWLTLEYFQILKTMYTENRIHHICLNILDDGDKFEKLSEWIKENNLILDTLYVSNTLDWISKKNSKERHLYKENLSKLMGENTIFITSSIFNHSRLTLRISEIEH